MLSCASTSLWNIFLHSALFELMELPISWLTGPLFDAEYKQYCLLAFLQYVEGRYKQQRLFPYQKQVQDHNTALLQLLEKIDELKEGMPKPISGLDRSGWQFAEPFTAGPEMQMVQDLAQGALPLLQRNLAQAEELLEELREHIHACTVGVMPLERRYGYLMLQQPNSTRVYEYQLDHLVDHTQIGNMRTRYISTWPRSTSGQFEQIKYELLKKPNAIGNPATFGFVSELQLPVLETYLPVAKRIAIKMARGQYTLSEGEK